MKKLFLILLALLWILPLGGCSSNDRSTIEIIIPPGHTGSFIYADQEFSPNKSTLKISAGAGLSSAEIILKPVAAQEETTYEPTIIRQREPLKLPVEKGAWFQIGVNIPNPSDVPIAVALSVEDVTFRIQ